MEFKEFWYNIFEFFNKMTALIKLYKNLKKTYGQPQDQWSLWCKRPKNLFEKEQVVIEAVLTQRTNWRNVELAMANLKRARLRSLKDIYELGQDDLKKLQKLIKPAGFFTQKAFTLWQLAGWIVSKGGLLSLQKLPSSFLREELLKIKGIGPETADSILLYALEKPVFVIDEYTRRWVKKENLSQNFSYSFLQNFFQANLKKDFRLYQDFHALIVIWGKQQLTAK